MNSKPLNWHGWTAIICASGPSMGTTALDVSRRFKPAEHKMIVINTTFRLFPNADVLYAGDYLWWKFHHNEARAEFNGQLWTCDGATADRWKINRIKGVNSPGLGHKLIHMNGNSGFQAINLAYLFGARRILLMGFDMKNGGKSHWHGDHPAPLIQSQLFAEWRHKGAMLAKDLKIAGCSVINCTPGTALTCFPISTLEVELGGT